MSSDTHPLPFATRVAPLYGRDRGACDATLELIPFPDFAAGNSRITSGPCRPIKVPLMSMTRRGANLEIVEDAT